MAARSSSLVSGAHAVSVRGEFTVKGQFREQDQEITETLGNGQDPDLRSELANFRFFVVVLIVVVVVTVYCWAGRAGNRLSVTVRANSQSQH